jgi:hypothetical protein
MATISAETQNVCVATSEGKSQSRRPPQRLCHPASFHEPQRAKASSGQPRQDHRARTTPRGAARRMRGCQQRRRCLWPGGLCVRQTGCGLRGHLQVPQSIHHVEGSGENSRRVGVYGVVQRKEEAERGSRVHRGETVRNKAFYPLLL